MKYDEVLEWMYRLLPMYQRQGKTAFKKDLTNIIRLAQHLGNPQHNFKSIHIAGTNGKGSVSHMLASIFQEAGYNTGLYTSPHLKDFRERIRLNGEMIRKNCVINFVKRNRDFIIDNQLSFFELSVGMAFEYFSKKKVDIAIIETGLGGRLDSTNIIKPELSVITNISLDHTNMLGNTLSEIAFEKGGIIKPETPIVLGEYNPETYNIFKEIANKNKALLVQVESLKNIPESDLKGSYQRKNIATVLKAIEVLRKKGYHISEKAVISGLKNIKNNTGLRGRWDILQKNPLVIADTAHNEAGVKEVMKHLNTINYKKLHIVLSMVNDKDIKNILKYFPTKAEYYFAKAQIPRGLEARLLKNEASSLGLNGNTYSSIQKAYTKALQEANPDDVIFIGGSTFTVAEII